LIVLQLEEKNNNPTRETTNNKKESRNRIKYNEFYGLFWLILLFFFFFFFLNQGFKSSFKPSETRSDSVDQQRIFKRNDSKIVLILKHFDYFFKIQF
jgi:hypothetical protein